MDLNYKPIYNYEGLWGFNLVMDLIHQLIYNGGPPPCMPISDEDSALQLTLVYRQLFG